MSDDLTVLADELYAAPPADFVAVRDEAVRAAKERGDKEFAAAAGRLRRPTRAAWLANLLARHRREQLDGLLELAGSLAAAQRTLDGDALRALSSRRRQLVAAMAREAGRLARDAHEAVNDSVLRELGDILEAALADPVAADEVRSGRLTRTISYSGFGPAADPGATPTPRPAAPVDAPAGAAPDVAERAEGERLRAERRADLDAAESADAAARERRAAAEAAHERAVTAHEAARDRVTARTAELDAAQKQERSTAAAGREASAAARSAARDAGTAATRTARARARVEELA